MSANRIVVQKFGGTSVQDADAMRRVIDIVVRRGTTSGQRPLVVLSAAAGVTNALIRISELSIREDTTDAHSEIELLAERHRKIATDLLKDRRSITGVIAQLDEVWLHLKKQVRGVHLLRELTRRSRDQFQAMGEVCSSLIFAAGLAERMRAKKVAVQWLDARKFFATSSDFTMARPDTAAIAKSMQRIRQNLQRGAIGVTQGFIGATRDGVTTTIGRGGSDFSAAIMGVAVKASEIQIWTDVAGIMTCDPRVAPKARVLSEIAFTDASALAYFGAKVLHPETVWPAVEARIPVRVLSSIEPEKPGTLILGAVKESLPISGIAFKRGVSILRVTGETALPQSETQQYAWDAMTSSKILPLSSASASDAALYVLDSDAAIGGLRSGVEDVAAVEIEKDKSLIALVGAGLKTTSGVAQRIFKAIGKTNCEMISYGGSANVVAFVVPDADSVAVVARLHREFFE